MPNIEVKLRRGTTSQHSSFTGAEGEVTVDTDLDTLRVHDGSTAGGVRLAKYSELAGAGAGGTVTSVDSGTGLTGGPITSSGTLSIANDGVGTAQIAANAVTSTEIADDAVTPAKLDDTQSYTMNGLVSNSTIAGTNIVESSGSLNQIVRSSSSSNLGYVVLNSGGEALNQKTVNLVPNGGKFIISWVNDDTTAGVAVQLDQATGSWQPNADNAQDLGSSSKRWDDIYATNGTIQTSDRNEKEEIEDLSEAELRVATAIKGLIKKFKFKGRVRKHIGVIAQDVEAAFTAEGLNASEYGLFCSDTFEDENGVTTTRLGIRYEELLAFVIAAM